MTEVLRNWGVVVIAVLLWLILSILSSFFLKRGPSARGLLNQLRFIFFPALIAYSVARVYWPPGDAPTPHKIATTVLAAASVVLGMGVLNMIFSPPALRRWFGRDVPSLFLDVVRYLIIVL